MRRRALPARVAAAAVALLAPAWACTVAAGAQLDRTTEPEVRLDNSLLVSPSLTELELRPGEERALTLVVRNRRTAVADLQLVAVGARGRPNPATPVRFVDPDRAGYETTSGPWIQPLVDTFALRPRERVEVPVTVRVPDHARPGGYHGGIAVRATRIQRSGDGSAVGVQTEVIAAILVTVPGKGARPGLRLRDVRAPRVVFGGERYRMRLELENTGRLHLVPRARMHLRTAFGNVAVRRSRAVRPMLPEARVRTELTWKRTPWLGLYTVKVLVKDPDGGSDRTTVRLLALPPVWVLVLAALLLAASVAWLVVRARRRDGTEDDGDGEADVDYDLYT